ncbi:hypothetical protein CONPUDRAFT_36420, partial [Coniophora puteana RWD-64-598 SS2]
LLLYSNIELKEKELPHRTKLMQLVMESFDVEYAKILSGIEGRVSFASDLWTDPKLVSFMAVTIHYMALTRSGYLALRTQLV